LEEVVKEMGWSITSGIITERQYKALKEAIRNVVERWHDKEGLTEKALRQRIRAIWNVKDERELLQADFPSVTEYLHRCLVHGCASEGGQSQRIKLLRQIHELRRSLGWDLRKLKELAKQKVKRPSLRSLREEELKVILETLKALRDG